MNSHTSQLRLSDHVIGLSLTSLFYFLGYSAVHLSISPLQNSFNLQGLSFASLVYLPHGVRVLTIWLYGWWGALYLLPASLISAVFYSKDFEMAAQATALSTLAVMAAFLVAQRMRLGAFYKPGQSVLWHDLLLVGALAAGFNAVFLSLLRTGEAFRFESAIFVGDILGFVVVKLCLLAFFRCLRKRANKPDSDAR